MSNTQRPLGELERIDILEGLADQLRLHKAMASWTGGEDHAHALKAVARLTNLIQAVQDGRITITQETR